MIARLRERYSVVHEPLRSERRVELVVVLLALLVVLQLLFLVVRYVATTQVRAVAPAPDSLTVVQRRALDTLTPEQSLEIMARPVFFASRRPLEPLPDIVDAAAGAEEEKPAGSLKGLKVLGIVANGGASRAIVSFKGEQQRLAVGESIEGWRLAEVSPGRVVLQSGSERDERSLMPMPVVAMEPAPASTDTQEQDAAMASAVEARRAAAARRREQLEQRRENAVRTLRAGGAAMNRTSGDGTR